MSKQQTLGDVLADPPRMGRESDIVKRMKRNVRKFDEYEARETYAVCIHCPDEANYHKENELFWDDECEGYLCERCLGEEEEAREVESEARIIIEQEKKFHHKGGI